MSARTQCKHVFFRHESRAHVRGAVPGPTLSERASERAASALGMGV